MSTRDDAPSDPTAPNEDRGQLVRAGQLRLRVVATVLGLEVFALLGVVVFQIANLIGGTDGTTSTSGTVMVTVYFVLVIVLIALLGRGVLRARGWARAPAVLTQLIALLGIGVPMLQGDLWYRFLLGVPIVAGSLAAMVLLLTPAVNAALHERD